MKELGLDIVRVTEAAAICASQWVGSGNKEEADKAATDAMRERLNEIDFCGQIAIGEGVKDESFGLFGGEWVGLKRPINIEELLKGVSSSPNLPKKIYSIAVDPIEGTTPTVTSGPEATAVIALAESGCMYATDAFYAYKIAYGPQIKNKVTLRLDDPIERTVELASIATGKPINNITVCVLDRPRHDKVIASLRSMGVRIKLIKDCDVSGALATCLPDSGVDLLYGIGGAPEAVISAAAIKCMGGDFQSQITSKPDWKADEPILQIEDLVSGPCIFAATGITDGSILRGVRFNSNGPITSSVFMRSESGTVRWLETKHGN